MTGNIIIKTGKSSGKNWKNTDKGNRKPGIYGFLFSADINKKQERVWKMEIGYRISEGHTGNMFQEHPVPQGSGAKDSLACGFQDMLSHQAGRRRLHGRRRVGEDGFSGPTEEELIRIKAERKKRWKREAEYSRLLEESSLRRRYKEKITVRKVPHGSFTIK